MSRRPTVESSFQIAPMRVSRGGSRSRGPKRECQSSYAYEAVGGEVTNERAMIVLRPAMAVSCEFASLIYGREDC